MEIYEYLERATADITLNRRAREVRQELHAHISFLADRIMQEEGCAQDQANARAMQQMGRPEEIRRSLAQDESVDALLTPRQLVFGVLTVLSGFAMILWSPAVLALLACGAAFALSRMEPSERRRPLRGLAALWRRHWLLAAVTFASGLYIGTEPIWAAGPGAPWQPPIQLMLALGPLLILACALAALRDLWRLSSSPAGIAGVATATFGVAALASSVGLWSVYRRAVEWFYAAVGGPIYMQGFVRMPIQFTALPFVGALALWGLVAAARLLLRGARVERGVAQ